MISDYPELLLFLPVLYAETHYRFKFFLSYLYKREPEIIADIPSRIDPGSDLPVLLIVKDAHRFPVRIETVNITDSTSGSKIDSFVMQQVIDGPQWEHIHLIKSEKFGYGMHRLNVEVVYAMGNKKKICLNDNHRGSSHAPLPVHVSSEPLPRIQNCVYGDTHVHTHYTSDQVEFAPTMKTIAILGRSMGLGYFCATDHSYDLDDHPENYLEYDASFAKWHAFREEVETFNRQTDEFVIIPGEEVSIRNRFNKNVHCLVYNTKRFLPGSGDGAERWPDTHCELSLPELLERVEAHSPVFAAHPGERPAFLQQLLINRGQWTGTDCSTPGLTGLQIINHAENDSDLQGKKLWIQTLLQGVRSLAICGTDAHGNFSRYRQIRFPFFTMKEHYYHLFGQWRTGIYPERSNLDISSVLEALKSGHSFLTDGPALRFAARVKNRWFESGSQVSGDISLLIQALSTPEFGKLSRITLFSGYFGDTNERVLKNREITEQRYRFEETTAFTPPEKHGYLRAEVQTADGKQALSNPIWF